MGLLNNMGGVMEPFCDIERVRARPRRRISPQDETRNLIPVRSLRRNMGHKCQAVRSRVARHASTLSFVRKSCATPATFRLPWAGSLGMILHFRTRMTYVERTHTTSAADDRSPKRSCTAHRINFRRAQVLFARLGRSAPAENDSEAQSNCACHTRQMASVTILSIQTSEHAHWRQRVRGSHISSCLKQAHQSCNGS